MRFWSFKYINENQKGNETVDENQSFNALNETKNDDIDEDQVKPESEKEENSVEGSETEKDESKSLNTEGSKSEESEDSKYKYFDDRYKKLINTMKSLEKDIEQSEEQNGQKEEQSTNDKIDKGNNEESDDNQESSEKSSTDGEKSIDNTKEDSVSKSLEEQHSEEKSDEGKEQQSSNESQSNNDKTEKTQKSQSINDSNNSDEKDEDVPQQQSSNSETASEPSQSNIEEQQSSQGASNPNGEDLSNSSSSVGNQSEQSDNQDSLGKSFSKEFAKQLSSNFTNQNGSSESQDSNSLSNQSTSELSDSLDNDFNESKKKDLTTKKSDTTQQSSENNTDNSKQENSSNESNKKNTENESKETDNTDLTSERSDNNLNNIEKSDNLKSQNEENADSETKENDSKDSAETESNINPKEEKDIHDILENKSKLDRDEKRRLLNKAKKRLEKSKRYKAKLTEENKRYLKSLEENNKAEKIRNEINDTLSELPSFKERSRGDGYSIDPTKLEKVPNSVIKTLIDKFLNQRFCKKETNLNVRSNSLEETNGFHKWKVKDVIVHLKTRQVTKVLTDKVGYTYADGKNENVPLSFYFDMSGSMSEYTSLLATIAIELLKKGVKVLVGYNEHVNVQIESIDKDITLDELVKFLENTDDLGYNSSSREGIKKQNKVTYININRNIDNYLVDKKAEKCVVFADFDPISEVINLSNKAQVYWFCFESAFDRYDLKYFQGFIYKVKNVVDLAQGLVKVNSKRFESLCFTDNPSVINRGKARSRND